MKKILLSSLALLTLYSSAQVQPVDELVKKVRNKLGKVKDYQANGRMKTNVLFLKVPVATVKVYYKNPNQLKIKNEKGISFIPKGAVTINMTNILSGNSFTAIDGGAAMIGSKCSYRKAVTKR